MLHLTHTTGYYAGLPICGLSRMEAEKRGDRMEHPAYSRRGIERQMGDPELCSECRRLWDEAVSSEEGEL